MKTLSKQLNKTFWAPSERSLCQEIYRLQWYDPTVGEFHLSGPESPHLDSPTEHVISLVKDLKSHCRLKSEEVTHLGCSGHLLIVFSQETAMIELSLLASAQLEHSYSCCHVSVELCALLTLHVGS